jgi:hypothetical protein
VSPVTTRMLRVPDVDAGALPAAATTRHAFPVTVRCGFLGFSSVSARFPPDARQDRRDTAIRVATNHRAPAGRPIVIAGRARPPGSPGREYAARTATVTADHPAGTGLAS